MEEKEYNVVTLEDGIEYTEIAKIENDGKTYVFLSNLDNPKDFCVRRLMTDDDGDYIIGLDNKEEFDTVMKLFYDKYIN